MGKLRFIITAVVFCLLSVIYNSGATSAACVSGQQACSSTYGVGQIFFGSGGSLDSTCSQSYCAKQSLSETGVGLVSSSNYQAYAGFNVNREPSLQLVVNTSSVNMGVISTTSTGTGTATFSVGAYLAGGYSIYTDSPPPQIAGYTMTAMSTPAASSQGTEQFGMNLVNNTTACGAPINFGVNPVQVPGPSYSYGAVSSNYGTCGKFYYGNNTEIAYSNSSSGITDFTISYIMNISATTPAGTYIMNDVITAVPTY